jgi:aspartate-semialdehyde dehydrogenase
MKKVPEFEKYPVSPEEMGKRYKNWTDGMAYQMMVLYRVGKETGGENFIKRLKEEYFKIGQNTALALKSHAGAKREEFQDCSGALPNICNSIDDSMANFWDGYIENTAKAFEKEIKTCPVARQWSKEPEFCDIMFGELVKGVAHALNPQFKTDGFSKLLVKGDNCCRYRIEMNE